MRFIAITAAGERQERMLSDKEEYEQTLRESLGIILNG